MTQAFSPTEIFKRATADRKSTRLNSSHSQISYAVFCLKKKKNNSLCLLAATPPNITSDPEAHHYIMHPLRPPTYAVCCIFSASTRTDSRSALASLARSL